MLSSQMAIANIDDLCLRRTDNISCYEVQQGRIDFLSKQWFTPGMQLSRPMMPQKMQKVQMNTILHMTPFARRFFFSWRKENMNLGMFSISIHQLTEGNKTIVVRHLLQRIVAAVHRSDDEQDQGINPRHRGKPISHGNQLNAQLFFVAGSGLVSFLFSGVCKSDSSITTGNKKMGCEGLSPLHLGLD